MCELKHKIAGLHDKSYYTFMEIVCTIHIWLQPKSMNYTTYKQNAITITPSKSFTFVVSKSIKQTTSWEIYFISLQ